MFSGSVKLQAVLFGEFKDILPTSDRIMKLMEMFSTKGFIPGTFLELDMTSPTPINRISLTSPNGEWLINIGSQRIDIFRNPLTPLGENLDNLGLFIDESNEIFEKLFGYFGRKGTRCALVTEYYFENDSIDEYNRIYGLLRKPFGLYERQIPFEWNIRDASRQMIADGALTDAINTISMINRAQGQLIGPGVVKPFDRIQIIFDINTIPDNGDQRFDIERTRWFFGSALQIQERMARDLSEVLNGK